MNNGRLTRSLIEVHGKRLFDKIQRADETNISVVDILVIVVLSLHHLVTEAEDGSIQSALEFVACGRIELFLQAFIERSDASRAAIDGSQHLDISNCVETEFLRDSLRDYLDNPVCGCDCIFGGKKEEVTAVLGKYRKFALIDEMGIGDDLRIQRPGEKWCSAG